MNLNIWELVKRLYQCFVKAKGLDLNKLEKELDEALANKTFIAYKYIRVKKGDRRYVLQFTDTTKQVPEWVRRKNLGRLTKKEMLCMN